MATATAKNTERTALSIGGIRRKFYSFLVCTWTKMFTLIAASFAYINIFINITSGNFLASFAASMNMNRPSFTVEGIRRNFNSSLEPPVQKHLIQVYKCLAMSSLAAAAGAYTHLFTDILSSNFLTSFATAGFLLAFAGTRDESGKVTKTRIGLLLGFAFCDGLGLGPLLNRVIHTNPVIISTAFFSTALMFTCFTLGVLISPRGQFKFLGGTLFSLILLLGILRLAFAFTRSMMIAPTYFYVGFAIACGFVLYDTHLIIEKRRLGDKDYLWHSLFMFIGFVDIFHYLLRFLAKKRPEGIWIK